MEVLHRTFTNKNIHRQDIS